MLDELYSFYNSNMKGQKFILTFLLLAIPAASFSCTITNTPSAEIVDFMVLRAILWLFA